ncbi:Outer membrane beta-barrel assembly protein BamD [hydrothermal vent metagenome]|uniref:Outer membrane beta-barrel assembly protein BamD n=1 Tax=hydrothermal vent metagenome TaxID=652676 RepID=A0A3B0Y038_9ZZZZ
MMRLLCLLILSPILSLFLFACAEDGIKKDIYADWSAEQFYDAATDALESGEFEKAITNLENLEARFPFNPYARQAQLDIAYAYYKFDEPESAISAADRFIRLNPRDPNVDYAWYLKGLADYNRGTGFLDSFFTRDISLHDNSSMQQSFSNFSTLVERYPESRYAQDAYQHMVFLRNKLAEAELHAANYYIKRKAWLAAARRGQYIIENYPTTPTSRKALGVMINAYTALGLDDLAADAQAVLEENPVSDKKVAATAGNLEIEAP